MYKNFERKISEKYLSTLKWQQKNNERKCRLNKHYKWIEEGKKSENRQWKKDFWIEATNEKGNRFVFENSKK